MHSESRKSDSDVKDDAGLSRAATGEQLKCERLSRVLENGYLVCDGMDINSTCWTRCIDGYEKENPLTGSYICLENREWEGEGATCVRKDCGSLDQVIVSLSKENTYILDIMKSNRKFDISLDGTLLSPTTNLNAFVLTRALQICLVRALRERKYLLRLPFLMSGMSTLSLLNAPEKRLGPILYIPISTQKLSGLTVALYIS